MLAVEIESTISNCKLRIEFDNGEDQPVTSSVFYCDGRSYDVFKIVEGLFLSYCAMAGEELLIKVLYLSHHLEPLPK